MPRRSVGLIVVESAWEAGAGEEGPGPLLMEGARWFSAMSGVASIAAHGSKPSTAFCENAGFCAWCDHFTTNGHVFDER